VNIALAQAVDVISVLISHDHRNLYQDGLCTEFDFAFIIGAE
jgi:hypothetical protein